MSISIVKIKASGFWICKARNRSISATQRRMDQDLLSSKLEQSYDSLLRWTAIVERT